jgi:hypothetical protein
LTRNAEIGLIAIGCEIIFVSISDFYYAVGSLI